MQRVRRHVDGRYDFLLMTYSKLINSILILVNSGWYPSGNKGNIPPFFHEKCQCWR